MERAEGEDTMLWWDIHSVGLPRCARPGTCVLMSKGLGNR